MSVESTAATRVAHLLDGGGVSLAVAESLTGGSLSAALAAAEHSSIWYRGGVIAYSSDVKHEVLGVPPGPVVSGAAASAMAEGVCRLLGADLSVSVTGVGGPESQDGQPPGTVWMGLHDRRHGTTRTRYRRIAGSPEEVVERTCREAIGWLLESIESGDLHREAGQEVVGTTG